MEGLVWEATFDQTFGQWNHGDGSFSNFNKNRPKGSYAAFLTTTSCFLVSGKVDTKKMYKLETAIKKTMAAVYPEAPNIKLHTIVAMVWPA